jgi:hypothetical protein
MPWLKEQQVTFGAGTKETCPQQSVPGKAGDPEQASPHIDGKQNSPSQEETSPGGQAKIALSGIHRSRVLFFGFFDVLVVAFVGDLGSTCRRSFEVGSPLLKALATGSERNKLRTETRRR